MALLEVSGIDVRFGGLRALSEVDLEVESGQVTGLIGPNGAGKTTLFNVICGSQPVFAGRVSLDGRDIGGRRPHQRARLGIARTFQRLEVFGSMTARDNVLVAAEVRRRWSRERFDPAAACDAVLDRVGLGRVADHRVDAMPTGLARRVELARALATAPRVLLLDEPSSGLDDAESQSFGRLLQELAGEGLAILLVEHDVDLVMAVCARVFVVDFGRLLAQGTPGQIQSDEAVRTAHPGVA
jgi:branched-chain amino acid transport system ATP-binding protein